MKNKNLIGGLFVGTFTNVVFWVLYTQTGNISVSIGITAVICIVLSGVLFWLGQVDKRKQN